MPEIYVPLLTIFLSALAGGGIGNNFDAVFGAFVVVFFLEFYEGFLVGVIPWLIAEQLAALR